ncbi:MAG TPA: VOC family protein [Acidimicrobiia bacterium]|nr:VOC family protein [Acidimicrobiia bacterium]
MEQRLSLITLGVDDLPSSLAFYHDLGWVENPGSGEEVAFFQVGSFVLALWDRAYLAVDSAVDDSGGWGGVTLAYNTRTPEEVDEVIEQARAAGAIIGREPAETDWGGYSGVFIDPNGHPWEVAYNPSWPLGDDGSVILPVG